MQTSTLDLLYMESDPRTGLPSACICIRPSGCEDYNGASAERLVSTHCMTFLELDAEIRRLQAELDSIRARARSKFYKALGCGCA
jgi:hypothetical protein